MVMKSVGFSSRFTLHVSRFFLPLHASRFFLPLHASRFTFLSSASRFTFLSSASRFTLHASRFSLFTKQTHLTSENYFIFVQFF
jgi:hypothetical protein